MSEAAVEREAILASLRERIVAFAAYKLAGDAAQDVAQEVMLVLHQKYRHLNRLEDLVPVSLKIARFKIAGLRRKSIRRGEYAQVPVEETALADPDADPGTRLERKEMLDRLTTAVSRLEERCRQIIRLKLEGRNFEEIRRLMGAQSINTVYTWDFRCRKRLLELMGGSWEGKR